MRPVDGEYADLHIHTSYSDGALLPEEVVRIAGQRGLRAVGITDHDCIDGFEDAFMEGNRRGVEVYTGVELSVRLGAYDVHLLGYFIDHRHKGLLEYLDHFKETRARRAGMIVEKLNELDVDLELSTVLEIAGKGSIGRMHIAKALVQEEHCAGIDAAFSQYLRDGGPAFVEKCRIGAEEAIEIIHKAGGLALLAHPGFYDDDALIAHLFDSGMDGLEVYNPKHSEFQVLRFQRMVRGYDGIESGGSDYHGGKENAAPFGDFKVPYTVVSRMKAFLAMARGVGHPRNRVEGLR